MAAKTQQRSGTKIVKCTCEHEYQDSIHGKGRRVANAAPKKGGYICTVCGKKHDF